MASLTPEQRQKGVICSSAGNHAQGVALAAMKLVCILCIFVKTRKGFTLQLSEKNYPHCHEVCMLQSEHLAACQ